MRGNNVLIFAGELTALQIAAGLILVAEQEDHAGDHDAARHARRQAARIRTEIVLSEIHRRADAGEL